MKSDLMKITSKQSHSDVVLEMQIMLSTLEYMWLFQHKGKYISNLAYVPFLLCNYAHTHNYIKGT